MNELKSLPKRVHLLGVSGAGMLPLALCLKQAGFEVSGEDDSMTEDARKRLVRASVILDSFAPGNEAYCLVRSSAISEDHPLVVQAQAEGCRAMRRGECLALLAKEKKLFAIAGSHGKTTTCGMVIDLFHSLGEKPSYALGGSFVDDRDPGEWNDSEWLIAELDESDGTIENFHPEVCAILNADWDHHSRYPSEADYKQAFVRLADRTRSRVIAHAELKELLSASETSVEYYQPGEYGSFDSNLFGEFNRDNAAIALKTLAAAGLSIRPSAYLEFSPIRRRQNILYLSPELTVVEDYAHHPVEIEAIATSLSETRASRSIAVFQPHRYSRTRSMKEELASSLSRFDKVYLLDVYGASEQPMEGGLGLDLHEACRSKMEDCRFFEGQDALLEALLSETEDDDSLLVTFLGAGTTNEIGDSYAKELERRDVRWGRFNRGVGERSSLSSKLRAQEPLASKTTLRVGGKAERYFEPSSIGELQMALRVCSEEGIPVYPLGRGSNLIVPDAGVVGLVIRLAHPIWRRIERVGENRLKVGAGTRIKELCGQACREGLEGFEFLEGIPGSVGGALRMNAGAMGGWMFDVVESVRYLTLEGTIVEAKASELEVAYRRCSELETALALDAVLKPTSVGASEAALREAIDVYQSKRKESQPREPSAGCIFKNPANDSAGRLIEELGLKGTAIGGAEISETHGNFIVNRGGATSEDVIQLVRLARREAKRRRSIDLEPEALLYGAVWKEALA